ncbi:MAG: SitI3 family protein [Leadbetterella sp.]
MALEYRLQIKTKISILNFLESYLTEKSFSYSKKNLNKAVTLYLWDLLGFSITISHSDKVFFDYLVNENKTIEEKWDYSNNITFRFDKFYDNLHARTNMLEICNYHIINTKEDIRLLFNGDVLVLERTDSVVNINKNFGFWNSDDLLNIIFCSS